MQPEQVTAFIHFVLASAAAASIIAAPFIVIQARKKNRQYELTQLNLDCARLLDKHFGDRKINVAECINDII